MNNLRFQEFYRRRLPHMQKTGATYFVTFRLKNSLPREILETLAWEAEQIKKLPEDKVDRERQHWFEKLDGYLEQVLCGEAFLEKEQIANLVKEAIHYRDGKVYDLVAFCIMPNHVHLICTPLEKEKGNCYSLAEILHSLKGHTARQSNLVLGRSGAFWQDESYDHIIRDEAELERTIKYILYNPVKAGLVREQSGWQSSYCKYEI